MNILELHYCTCQPNDDVILSRRETSKKIDLILKEDGDNIIAKITY